MRLMLIASRTGRMLGQDAKLIDKVWMVRAVGFLGSHFRSINIEILTVVS